MNIFSILSNLYTNKQSDWISNIEDTDIQRSKKEFLDSQLKSLKWLSLLPDEPIVYQSQRMDEYQRIITELLDKKLAYPCFCDPLELEKKRSDSMQLGKTYQYDKRIKTIKKRIGFSKSISYLNGYLRLKPLYNL